MSGYTQIPNWLFDDIMPKCAPNEWRIVCVVARQTFGWGKESDRIGLSLFAKLSGIGSRPTVVKAIESAVENGFIIRTKAGNSFNYSINNGLETKPVQKLNQFRNQTNSSLETKPKMVQKLNTQNTKETIKENIYIYPDIEPISDLKTELAKISKTPLWPKTEKQYDDAAYFFLGMDVKPEQLSGFTGWWTANGYYSGKPAIKSIVDEWQNYTNGVTYSQNGNHQEAEEVAPSGAF